MASPQRDGRPAGEDIPAQTKDAPGPDTPLGLGKAGWRDTLKRAVKEFSADRCTMTAGSLAYQWFLSLFPALIALLGVVSLVQIGSGTVKHLVNGLNTALPPGASGVFSSAVTAATSHSAKGSLLAVIIGIVLAVWSASAAMTSLQTGLDIAYDVPKDRKFLAKRLYAGPLMLATVVFGGIAAALIVFGAPLGTAIEAHVPVAGAAFIVVWTVVRWLLTIIVISMLFSAYYYLGPNRETPRWQWVSPGGVVILIFWLYLTGIAILFGAEVNAEAERQAAAEAGHPRARASARKPNQAA